MSKIDYNKTAFTTGEVAYLCGVKSTCVLTWTNSGKLPCFRVPSRGGGFCPHRRIPRTELVKFMKENNIPLGGLEEGEKNDYFADTTR